MAAKRTQAHKALRKNLKRASALSRIFDAGNLKPKAGDKRGAGNPSGEERELLRAAVIFSIGALDAYLSDVAAEILVGQMEKARVPTSDARALFRRVLKEIDTLPLELALTSDADERSKLAQRAITEHLTNKVSNHGAAGVATTLGRLGASIEWDKIVLPNNSSLKASSNQTCPAVLDRWTRIRHNLVHQGKSETVRAEQARDLIAFVEAIADHVDAQAIAALS
jgi:hypothetical protein